MAAEDLLLVDRAGGSSPRYPGVEMLQAPRLGIKGVHDI
jgi:hypothetical protein